jgi:hypothetical protein
LPPLFAVPDRFHELSPFFKPIHEPPDAIAPLDASALIVCKEDAIFALVYIPNALTAVFAKLPKSCALAVFLTLLICVLYESLIA